VDARCTFCVTRGLNGCVKTPSQYEQIDLQQQPQFTKVSTLTANFEDNNPTASPQIIAAMVNSYLEQEALGSNIYTGIHFNPGPFWHADNKHRWITGDDARLHHLEVIGSGASGDVHLVCHEVPMMLIC
jgi:hypothetical protein